ncbi:hypothetical protein GGR92_000018 [Spirosoma lacussanchae]|uniref:hypothetical protein n=1 Tax=Spirosoma lacussanchae TaxID=1884249 RepID=UPI001109D904|nr:hypothetical protein [Spirosoma lacussanchae]
MELLERELEDMIYEAGRTPESRADLAARGLPLNGVLTRQLQLPPYGIADLVSLTYEGRFRSNPDHPEARIRHFVVDIYELKRGPITYKTLGQACRYKTALEEQFGQYANYRTKFDFRINLIGNYLDRQDEDFMHLLASMPLIRVYSFYFTYSGLHFRHERPEVEVGGSANPGQLYRFKTKGFLSTLIYSSKPEPL